MKSLFKKKKRDLFLYEDDLYAFLNDNVHFLLCGEYSFEDIEYALQHVYDEFYLMLDNKKEKNKK